MDRENPLDLAIVGMGPAGLYTCWRLHAAPGNDFRIFDKPRRECKIHLFDAEPPSRIGGRLCTQPLPGYPFLAELGGMRYRENQLLVKGLVDAFNLGGEEPPEFAFEERFFYLRGQQLKAKALNAFPYNLNDDEKGKKPAQLIEGAIAKALKGVRFPDGIAGIKEFGFWGIDPDDLIVKLQKIDETRSLSAREWALVKRYGYLEGHEYLYEIGFWDLLQQNLSSEGWHLAHDGLGYESVMGNWNAGSALPWFLKDFATDRAFTIPGGMSKIAQALYNEVSKLSEPKHGWELTSINLERTSADHPSQETLLRLHFAVEGHEHGKDVFSRGVVLALPKGALIRLNMDPALSARRREGSLSFKALLNSVEGHPLFKLFLGYEQPWWEFEGERPHSGRVNSDLPLRQSFYYDSNDWDDNRREELGLQKGKDQHAMIMASYSDSHYIEFWRGLTRQDQESPYTGAGGKASLSDGDNDVLERYGAPRGMMLRAERQLGILHGEKDRIDSHLKAQVGLYMEWSRPPFYAGWHAWKPGSKPYEIRNDIMQPFRETNIFICGEAYSNEQGWTEGALKSAERLVRLGFGAQELPPVLGQRLKDVDFDEYLDTLDTQPRMAARSQEDL